MQHNYLFCTILVRCFYMKINAVLRRTNYFIGRSMVKGHDANLVWRVHTQSNSSYLLNMKVFPVQLPQTLNDFVKSTFTRVVWAWRYIHTHVCSPPHLVNHSKLFLFWLDPSIHVFYEAKIVRYFMCWLYRNPSLFCHDCLQHSSVFIQ